MKARSKDLTLRKTTVWLSAPGTAEDGKFGMGIRKQGGIMKVAFQKLSKFLRKES